MDTATTKPPPIGAAPGFRGWARWGWLAGPLVLAGLFVLWRFEPAGQFFFPRCWLYQTTGLQCPGCGTTRALHALLHGDVVAALRLNGLAVVGLVLGGWFALRWGWAWRTGRWWRNPFAHPYMIAALGGLTVGFGIARNLTW